MAVLEQYKLNFGRCVTEDPRDLDLPASQRRERIWFAGEVVETDQDLLRFNGKAGDSRKFERLSDIAPNPRAWDPKVETLDEFTARMRAMDGSKSLTQAHPVATTAVDVTPDLMRAMSVEELRSYAEGEEIDLRGAATKEAILTVLTGKTVAPQQTKPAVAVKK